MCDFKPGDEVVKYRIADRADNGILLNDTSPLTVLPVGFVGVVERVEPPEFPGDCWGIVVVGQEGTHCADFWRKVQRRKTDLSIESFLTIKPGFEEPRRPKAPAKKERVS